MRGWLTELGAARAAALAFGPRDGGAQDAQDLVGPGFARPVEFGLQPMLGGLAGGEQLLPSTPTRVPVVAGLAATAAVAATGASSVASATSVAASSPVPLWATASGPAFGMMYASAGSSAASSGAGSAGASVTKLAGPHAARRAGRRETRRRSCRPLSRPSAASKTSSAVRPICAALRSIALMALRLVLGLRRSFSSALRIWASWARLKGYSTVIGGVLSGVRRRDDRDACYHPEPRRQCRSGPIASHEYPRRLRRAHEGVSGPIHQL